LRRSIGLAAGKVMLRHGERAPHDATTFPASGPAASFTCDDTLPRRGVAATPVIYPRVAVTPGQSLMHFRLIAKIDEGGVGEV
jgi:hypothetical protein